VPPQAPDATAAPSSVQSGRPLSQQPAEKGEVNRQDAKDAKGEPKNSDDFLFANLALLASWRFSPLFAFSAACWAVKSTKHWGFD
jgi:hypothetical protein